MCGRTACTLAPNEVCQACSYPSKNKSKKGFSYPQWKDHPGNYSYTPSTNIAPSTFTPVLIKNKSCKRESDGSEKTESKYVVQPMMWGLIPSFFKGESPKDYGFKTNNCRIEDIESKKTYKPSLNKGQRCVVLCEGFYEWKTDKQTKSKQPYFIHAKQPEGMEIWNKTNSSDELWNEVEGWKGVQLLKMAGLYSHWISTKGEEIYSYAVITMESDEKFSWLHHRIPAILETDEDVQKWLEDEDYKVAISNLRAGVAVTSYPVSSEVNNSRNKDENLFYPIKIEKKETGSSKLMAGWLKSGVSKSTSSGEKEREKKEPEGIMKWLEQGKNS